MYSAILRPLFLRYFKPLRSFFPNIVHSLTQLNISKNQGYSSVIAKNKNLRTLILLKKYSPNESNLRTYQHPNFKFFLSSNKLKFNSSKRISQTVLHKTQSWMYTTRLSLLMQGSILYPKIKVLTHHYQWFSSSQYLLQMQV